MDQNLNIQRHAVKARLCMRNNMKSGMKNAFCITTNGMTEMWRTTVSKKSEGIIMGTLGRANVRHRKPAKRICTTYIYIYIVDSTVALNS